MKPIRITAGKYKTPEYQGLIAYLLGPNMFGGYDCKALTCMGLLNDWENFVLVDGEFVYI